MSGEIPHSRVVTTSSEYLIASEAAQYVTDVLGIKTSAETIRRWAIEKRIAHTVTPGGRRFTKADLDAAFRRVEPIAS